VTSLRAFAASTSEIDALDFRFWHKPDMLNALANVGFWGKADSD
jgi:hypothetical protein